MLLETNIKTIVNYAERRIIWVTPNEAKRLGGDVNIRQTHHQNENAENARRVSANVFIAVCDSARLKRDSARLK